MNKPLLYTEIETYPASMKDRVRVMNLIYRMSIADDITWSQRFKMWQIAIKHYVFTIKPYVSHYVSSREM